MADCYDKINEAMRKGEKEEGGLPEYDRKKMKEWIDELDGLKKSDTNAFIARSKELIDGHREEMAVKKLQVIQNGLKKAELKKGIKDSAISNKITALSGRIVGTEAAIGKGSNDSVHARAMSNLNRLVNTFVLRMEDQDLWKYFTNPANKKNLMIDLWHVADGKSKSGDPLAFKAVQEIKAMDGMRVKMLQDAGSAVEELKTWVMRGIHDADKIRPALGKDTETAFKEWSDDVLAGVDHKLMFKGFAGNDKAIKNQLREMFDEIIIGQHDKINSGGSTGLDKRVSMSRYFAWKDGESFYNYSQKYGSEEFSEALFRSNFQSSRNAALIHTFGTSPREMFDEIRAELKVDVKDDPVKLKEFTKWESWVNHQFAEMEGHPSVAGRGIVSKVAASMRAINTIKHLFNTTISAITDIPISASVMKSSVGGNFLDHGFHHIRKQFALLKGPDRLRLATALRTTQDLELGHLYSKFTAGDGAPRMLSLAVQQMFKWNGLQAWTESGRMAFVTMFSSDLRSQAGKAFKDIEARTQRLFDRYNITPAHWDVMRLAQDDIGEHKLLTPEAVLRIDNAEIKKIMSANDIKGSVEKFKQDVDDRFSMMMNDTGSLAVPTPSARERAVINQGTVQDTLPGDMLRLMGQFKQYPLVMRSVAQRILMSDPKKGAVEYRNIIQAIRQGDANTLAYFIMGTTTAGYIGMAMTDILKGKEPRNPADPKTMLAAFMRGGSAGVYGDFLLGGYSKFGGGTAAAVLGPTLGDVFNNIDNVKQAGAIAFDGDKGFDDKIKGIGKELKDIVAAATPFPQNAVLIKPALDYLILWRMNEYLNPGHLKRLEKNTGKEPGIINKNRKYWPWKPTDFD